MIVVIDNYDSFVYNLVQLFLTLDPDVRVFRNDEITVERIAELRPSHIVVSPGPCTPAKAGISLEVIKTLGPIIPLLGVCLGHEAVGKAFGAKLIRSKRVFHGKTSDITHDRQSIFMGIDSPMVVGRYHSLEIDPESLPPELQACAWAEDGTLMALRHKTHPIQSVQFHPESVLTPQGRWLCENFLLGARQRTTVKSAIGIVLEGEDLSVDQAADAMKQILSGDATPAQIASLITALRCKGEAVTEVAGFAGVMRTFARKLNTPDGPILDTCGTGGDGAHTFNISTVAALVAAGAGCKVAKHGNRSVTSKSGSADVLAELGVNIACPLETMELALREANICFLFAPLYHAAMKYAMGPRREIGARTVFNMLGPLTNPAGAKRQLLGVYDPKLCETFARVLLELGSEKAMVVHGHDGLDEITLTGPTQVATLDNGDITLGQIAPEDLGLATCRPEALLGGTPRDNAKIARSILDGEKGAPCDIVLLNAAAALVCSGQAQDLAEGIRLSKDSIDSGNAQNILARLVEITNG